MKGIFEIKPALPKYNCTWDVDQVLGYLKTLSPLSDLSLLQMSQKIVTLFGLSTGQRAQSLHLFEVRNIDCSDNCINVNTYTVPLGDYMARTSEHRVGTQLFIRTQKPYSWVSKVTISHWIKQVLRECRYKHDYL